MGDYLILIKITWEKTQQSSRSWQCIVTVIPHFVLVCVVPKIVRNQNFLGSKLGTQKFCVKLSPVLGRGRVSQES